MTDSASHIKSQSLQRKLDQQKAHEDFVKCELCRRQLRNPKTLPCLHSYCKDCLRTYLKQTVSNSTTPEKLITCPVCLQTSNPPVAGKLPEEWVNYLPTNEFLSSYLEAVDLKDTNRQCDTCTRQHKSSLAKQWCSYCHDALCNDCVGFHNALKTTNGHNLIVLENIRKMPISDIISEPLCHSHEGETVTSYCENHQEIICEKCKAGNHRNCSHVKPLKDAAQRHRPDIAEITQTLDDESKLARSIHGNRTTAEGDLGTNQVELLHKIQSVRQKINENLSKCESQIIGELYDISGRDKAAIQTETKEAQRIRKSASKTHSLVDSANKYGSSSHVMQTIPPAARQANHYKGKLLSLNGGIKNTKIEFIIDPVLEKAMNVNQLGGLHVTHTSAEVASSAKLKVPERGADSDPEDEYDFTSRRDKGEYDARSMKSIKSKRSIIKSVRMSQQSLKTEKSGPTAEFITSFNGKTPSDHDNCWFTGIEYLPDGRIIMVDRNNSKVKVFGTDYNLQIEVKLQQQPFGLALLPSSEIAVTVPRENTIELFTVTDMALNPRSTIKTSDRCYGIAFDGARFFVACTCASPAVIKIIMKNGEEQYDVCPEENYYPMFFRPWYVKIDQSGTNTYISDSNRNHLVCILTGHILKQYTYKHSSLTAPRGLATLKDNRVIVCGFGTDNIQLIAQNGTLVKDLLTRKDGIMGPQTVALNSACETMAVTFDPSSGTGETVKLFRLKL